MAGANSQRTGFVDTTGPMTHPEIHWVKRLGLPGESNTQPVLDASGNIYVTVAPRHRSVWDIPDKIPAGALISLRPDGTERWRYTWTWNADAPEHQGSWSQLSGPVITRDRVVMGHRQGVLRAWNKDTGVLVWERDLSPDASPITSTPVADRSGFLYVHCRDIPTVRKIDSNGLDVWSHRFVDGEAGHTASPSLSPDEKTLYIGRSTDFTSYLYAIDTSTGEVKWAWSPEVSQDHSFAWPLPAAGASGVVYIQDEKLSHLYAVRDTGRVHALQWARKPGGRGAPRLMALDETGVYTAHTIDARPVIFAVNNDGSDRWTRTLSHGTGVGGLVVSPTALYFGVNGTGTVHALDKSDGTTIWSRQAGAPEASFSEGLTLSPAGVLYAAVSTTERGAEPVIVALGEDDALAQGYVNQWLVCGPFENAGGEGHGQVYEPEKELDFTAIYFGKNDTPAHWQPTTLPVETAFVRLADTYAQTAWASAYALCWVENKGSARMIDFRIGTANSVKLFLNDDVIFERATVRSMRPDSDVVPVSLPAGFSTVMLKLSHDTGDWGFYFRITERGDTRVPEDITASYIPGHIQTTIESNQRSPAAVPAG